ncbi:MAG TPA: glycosyltransferase family 87 protein [Anaerolineales bacterium]|nr:glycosyltransferase family 87 protein [Anaerolineales bacterium]
MNTGRPLLLVLLIALFFVLLVLIALYMPTSLPTNSDFSAIYNTDLALVHRVPIYDLEKVQALAVQYSGIPREKFFLARFPYPPWYALSTFYLGLLPARAAATFWFELNLVMLFLSIWLLTQGWPGRLRLLAFPLGLFFLPVLGALSVGQYDFPVLLGTALLIYSLRKENIALTVLGMVLLTFKPHIGALILLSALMWLIVQRSNFGRDLLRPLLAAGVALLASGFLADPAWIISYPKMLLHYQNEGNVSACSECASLPVWLSRRLLDGSLSGAAWIAIILLCVLIGLLFLYRSLWRSPALVLSAALLITLLVSPYLYNYDFLLLLVPFAVLIPPGNVLQKIIILLCDLVPTFALIGYGRNANLTLIVASLVMLLLLYRRARKPVIDVPASAAYNTNH